MDYEIHRMSLHNWEQVRSIYIEGIQTGNATFQTEAPSWDEWDSAHVKTCRLVMIYRDKVIGWAALSPVSSRCVYAGIAEVSVYLAQDHRAKGIGVILMEELIRCSEQNGFWTLQSGIFPENRASLAVHKRCGFREIGVRKKVGKMNGTWRDTVLVERRSEIVGVD